MSVLDDVLDRVAVITIEGWYDFQEVQGVGSAELWALHGNSVMPVPVPPDIRIRYQQILEEARLALAQAAEEEKRQAHVRLEAEAERLREIALPPGCYICPYKVKRPGGTYEYLKLWHRDPVFNFRGNARQRAYWQSQGKQNMEIGKVRNRHLGKPDSEAHRAAIAGIQARKHLAALERQLYVLGYEGRTTVYGF